MPPRYRLHIEKLVMGGLGLGRLPDGLVILVPQALPGETVLVKAVTKKKSYLEARLLDIMEPSPSRVSPSCPLYGRCGGCDFQHVGPEVQAQLKSTILTDQLLRARLLTEDELAAILTEPLAAPFFFNYRQRIRLQINSKGECGFLLRHSHQIVPTTHCLLARQELNQVLASLADYSKLRHLLSLSSSLELLFSPVGKQVILVFHFLRKPRPTDIKAAAKGAEQLKNVCGIVLQVEGRGRFGPYSTDQDAAPLLSSRLKLAEGHKIYFRFEPGTFCQVNLAQNEQLVNLLLDWAAVQKYERVLDLFCGMGNFSLPLAIFAREVLGMDLQRAAIRSAAANAGEFSLKNCRFERLAAAEGAKQCLARQERFDLVLLDPPRAGCRDAIPAILELSPARIIYISCDPATLCRDLGMLTDNGYQINRIKMVDMFPQTHHIETIAMLIKY